MKRDCDNLYHAILILQQASDILQLLAGQLEHCELDSRTAHVVGPIVLDLRNGAAALATCAERIKLE